MKMCTTRGVSITAWVALWCMFIGSALFSPHVFGADSATEQRIRNLRSGSPVVRRNAAKALGRIADASAVPHLTKALHDTDATVRREAAEALGFIKDDRAVEPLIDALEDDDASVRMYAAYALGEIKQPGTAEALLTALGDREWCVRDHAAWALREIATPEMAGPLVEALKQPKADTQHTMWLLKHVIDGGSVGPFVELLDNDSASVRIRAVRMLSELDVDGRVGLFIAALSDGNADVRRIAVESLGELRDDRAEGPLEKLLRTEKDPSVRKIARSALVRLRRHKDLVAWWSFDNPRPAVAKDVTGRGSDGELHGCVSVRGKIGRAMRFGSGDYIELGKPSGLPIANQPFTVMAWAKTASPRGVVVARGGAFSGFSLYIMDGVPKFGIHRVKDGPAYIAAARDEIGSGWVHLAGVVKANRIELYVNGKLAATKKTPGYIPSNCGQGMEIGFDVSNSAAEITDHFDGLIDEVKMYDAAISMDEIVEESRKKQLDATQQRQRGPLQ